MHEFLHKFMSRPTKNFGQNLIDKNIITKIIKLTKLRIKI